VSHTPLLSEAPLDAPFALLDERIVSRAEFLADVLALADRLPEAEQVLNLCDDRYQFARCFCAALLRGQISLLPNNRSQQVIDEIAAAHPGCYRIADRPAVTGQTRWFDCRQVQSLPSPNISSHTLDCAASIDNQQLAAVLYTSGSTGEPGAHGKTWGTLTTVAKRQRRYMQQAADRPVSALLATVPPQHMYGFEASVMLPLQSSLPLWHGRPLFPQDVRDALTACGSGPMLVTTPVHLRALLRAALPMPSCALLVSATAPLDDSLAAQAEVLFEAPLHEVYGSTETGAVAGRRLTHDAHWRAYSGLRLSPREDGGAELHAEHLADPIALGDRIEILPDGRFSLHGRLDDAINIAGKRAALGDLNHRLLDIPGVLDGVIFSPGEKTTGLHEQRLAAIAVAPGLDSAAVLAGLRERIDPAFLPRRIVLVEQLPRNETGKLTRSALLDCWRAHAKSAR
jgi:acyl-coenzyme A synthetase/AMP-(fatty) acid ligase